MELIYSIIMYIFIFNCAPIGNKHSGATYGYVAEGNMHFGDNKLNENSNLFPGDLKAVILKQEGMLSLIHNTVKDIQKENLSLKQTMKDFENKLRTSELTNKKLLSKLEDMSQRLNTCEACNSKSTPKDQNNREMDSEDGPSNVATTKASKQKSNTQTTNRTRRSSHRKLSSYVTQLNRRQLAEPNTNVAFSAFVKTDITSLVIDQAVHFDGIVLNNGGSYNPATGIFTAPRDGVYLFSFCIEGQSEEIQVYLAEENVARSKAVVDPYDKNQDIMGGNTVLLHLSKGNRVWISISHGSSIKSSLSTFSGVLLY